MAKRMGGIGAVVLLAAMASACASAGDRNGSRESGAVTQPGSGSGDSGSSSGDGVSCSVSGCASEICASEPLASLCLWRDAFACYRDARCQVQATGYCGWTLTASLAACLTGVGETCAGFAGKACAAGDWCLDDPNDDCDPANGGADCGGVCVVTVVPRSAG